ncbi:hypothetical protein CHH80_19700 [Bacillus sp. 7504-2]|nr:hypothetical protein CHH80_19700 [Bacillus sp. 7504-2]
MLLKTTIKKASGEILLFLYLPFLIHPFEGSPQVNLKNPIIIKNISFLLLNLANLPIHLLSILNQRALFFYIKEKTNDF